MTKNQIEQLRKDLLYYNKVYREGFPVISDLEYDHLVEQFHKVAPNDTFFKNAVQKYTDERMERLPVPMYSLEKIKTTKEFRRWLQNMVDGGAKKIMVTPKFDGISLLVNDHTGEAWTRGDGVEGQRSSAHYKQMNSPIVGDIGEAAQSALDYSWGEAIMPKSVFAQLKAECADFVYKNARNMVAGVFNSPDGYKSPYIQYIDFIRYGSTITDEKDKQLTYLGEIYGSKNVAPNITVPITDLTVNCTDEELNDWVDEAYKYLNRDYRIDGIVIEITDYVVREQLGRLSNGNPMYAIAYKKEEWCETYQTVVEDVKFKINKDGDAVPVIIVEPVEMEGATVSRCSAYNMKYVIENHICPGAIIEITRSGDVIPKHLMTHAFSKKAFEQFVDDKFVCPSCGMPLTWDATQTSCLCTNPHCTEKRISQLVYFFRTMGCEEFEEPTIRTLWKDGAQWHSIKGYLETSQQQFQELLGEVKGKTVYSQIDKVMNGVPFARILTALNVFGGVLAEKTCQKILDNFDIRPFTQCNENPLFAVGTLTKIPGIGEVIAKAFIDGLNRLKTDFKDVLDLLHISYIETPKVEVVGDTQYKVCFTGFRDKTMEEKFKANGHIILSGVTKECNLLVVADANSTSSKIEKARKSGIKIVTKQEADALLL